ncbi:hypothetical protein RF11_10576 [Thelohanellus kitauei]|uniref:Uncharacterized protein n=1 Tax=Thelohanellus kitauei TaxID=669202 RepID=A0A0C2N494_THEKT|nr:hypothetical protein RF11_10576 [Thelohanellus kitauei]
MRLHLLSLLLMTLSQELFFIYEATSTWKMTRFAVLVFTSLMNFVISTANELKALSYSKTNLRSISLLFSCLHVLMLCTCSKVDDVEDQKETKDKNVFVEIIQGLHKKEVLSSIHQDIDQIITALYLLFKVTNTKV